MDVDICIYPGNQHVDQDVEPAYYFREFLHASFQSIALPCPRGNCLSDFYNHKLVLHIFCIKLIQKIISLYSLISGFF